ncbi:hypothetical protein FI667_g3325, partial [Globisporangium splendens]
MAIRISSASPRSSGAGFGRVVVASSPSPCSPRVRAKSASICTPTRPGHPAASSSTAAAAAAGIVQKHPSTVGGDGTLPPQSAGLPPTSSSTAAAAIPTRKFEVQKRNHAMIGGIAGVPNALSVREPLPYR